MSGVLGLLNFSDMKTEFRKRQRSAAAAIERPDQEFVDHVEEMR